MTSTPGVTRILRTQSISTVLVRSQTVTGQAARLPVPPAALATLAPAPEREPVVSSTVMNTCPF
ncbi:hypothetical protein GCM10011583_30040 [Streptomyces camponoticapitis]|uniref:Uncharacterized protein n=1 Tax=Streptomyces camponoticapitis TaxID=1616125 RepID=A0ABQ2E5A3_9ACTN|nr:hypothetical protein GCM10011583_30040 [Streptomyces camponoticapitis]